MLITPLQLENEPLQLAESFEPGSIDFIPGIQQLGQLAVDGKADLIVENRGGSDRIADIRVRAHYKGTFEMECARSWNRWSCHLTGPST